DGDELFALRHRPFRCRSVSWQSPAIRLDDRRGTSLTKNGARPPPHLRPDARTEMGDFDGRLRLDWRRVRQLRARPGRRPGRPCRRLRARLSAAPRITHLRHRHAPAEDRAAEARVMDATTLTAALRAAVPGLHCDAAPSVDLQTTIYVSRDDVPAVARPLREAADFRVVLL